MNKKTGADVAEPSDDRKSISIALLLVGLLLFGLLTAAVQHGVLSAWEGDVLRYLNGLPDSWYPAVAAVTFLGSGWMVVVAVITAYALKRYRLTWKLALATSTVYLAGTLAKELIARPRPAELFANVQVFVQEAGMGFPSLHTAIATALVVTMVMHARRPWWFLACLPVIAAVGLSRIYLGVHLPLDVMGGAVLGVVVTCAFRSLPSEWRSKLYLD